MNHNFVRSASHHKERTLLVRLTGFAALLTMLIASLAASVTTTPAVSAQGNAQEKRPAFQVIAPTQVNAGEPIVLQLNLRRGVDVGGFETHLLFDTASAEFGGFDLANNSVSQTGREIQPLLAQNLQDGVAVGFYSCPFAKCDASAGESYTRGGDGDLALATLTLTPKKRGNLELRFSATRVVNTAGQPVVIGKANLVVNVQVTEQKRVRAAPQSVWALGAAPNSSGGAFDLTGDGQVNSQDLAIIEAEWQRTREQGAPCENLESPAVDVNQDGCVDVADAQLVAAQLGSTVQPTPPGEPTVEPTPQPQETPTAQATTVPGPTPIPQANVTFRANAPAELGPGQPIEVELVVEGAEDIAGFEMQVLYDSSAAEFAGLHIRENGLKQKGRDVVPLSAIQLPEGASIGAFSCPVEQCAANRRSQQNNLASGTVQLGSFELIPLKPGVIEITFASTQFVDSQGNIVPVRVDTPSLTITIGGRGDRHASPAARWALETNPPGRNPRRMDVTEDGQVTNSDAMSIALEWTATREKGAGCGSAMDRSFDLNRDGCIDVADIQLAAVNSAPQAIAPEAAEAALTFTVNTLGDVSDAKLGDRICDSNLSVAGQQCTLRAAVGESNGHIGPDNIVFNLPGSGVQTIQLTKSIRVSDGGLTIDGYTQPGAQPNTDPLLDNAVILIQLRGNGANDFSAFELTSPGNVIKGLALFNLRRSFYLYGSSSNNNVIIGNFIGTDAAGNFVAPTLVENAHGVMIEQGASQNRVGGTAPADRNVISGNARSGVAMWHEGTASNVVQNNLVGLGPAGNKRLPNRVHGIDMNYGVRANLIGGTGQGERNVISGNDASGAEVSHTAATRDNNILGNYIGTDVTGNLAPSWAYNGLAAMSIKDRVTNNTFANNVAGNSVSYGVRIDNFGTCCLSGNQFINNRIGIGANGNAIPNAPAGVWVNAPDTAIGSNLIANNSGPGIRVEGAANDRNRITQNSIFNNSGLGIDLEAIGSVNGNDALDADTGANEGQNYPVLTAATSAGGSTSVQGTLGSKANSAYTLEFFSSSSCDSSGYGEGETPLGSLNVNTNASGTASFDTTLPVGTTPGRVVTATATDAAGNTSEFSQCRNVTGSGATTYVNDTFSRTVNNSWGSADVGGSYALSGVASQFAVNGTTGTMNIPTIAGANAARLLAVNQQDVDLRFRFQTNKAPAGGYGLVNFNARRVGNGDEYRGRVRFDPSGAVLLQASRLVNGSETLFGTLTTVSGLTHTANSYIWVRGQVTGVNPTTIRLKAWADGQPEPTNWQFTATDSAATLQTSGSVGLAARLPNTTTNVPILFSFDNFTVVSP